MEVFITIVTSFPSFSNQKSQIKCFRSMRVEAHGLLLGFLQGFEFLMWLGRGFQVIFCLVLLLIMRILSNFNSLIHVTPRSEALNKHTDNQH